MKLISDFTDYYDHQFGLDGPDFRRVSTEGPNRIKQFAILDDIGLTTPPHGFVKDVMEIWWEQEKQWVRWLVVYYDLMAHCGEGKRLMQTSRFKWDGCISRLEDITKQCETLFCSAFVGNGYGQWQGRSWRMLQVGPHRFWIEYNSSTDWRSNCGEGSCELFLVEKDFGVNPKLPLPLYAIDFVHGKSPELYAVDLNIAPGIRGTGVEKCMPPKEMAMVIGEHMATYGSY